MSEVIVKWHKVVMRELTKEDYDRICDTDVISNDAFLCDMPEDGQKILVATPCGTEICRCIKSYSVIYGASWLDVIAWANVPEYAEVEKAFSDDSEKVVLRESKSCCCSYDYKGVDEVPCSVCSRNGGTINFC